MKLILSRKGFDSSSGGGPSPIFPDGRMVSLPIPDRQSPIRYADIRWHEYNLGSLVSDLTGGRIPASYLTHLDPDLNYGSLPRQAKWKPLFGQTGAAQGHLRRSGVVEGDVFLFFGLFQHVVQTPGGFAWDTTSPPRHVVWGWLQAGEVLAVDSIDRSRYQWAENHPHFHRSLEKNNTLYISREYLKLPSLSAEDFPGAGVFPRFSECLKLTASSAGSPCLWELPPWIYPENGRFPLTYHGDPTRWQRTGHGTLLKTVTRGQEFVLDCEAYPEAIEWFMTLLCDLFEK
jgi:hypothetical protein